MLKQENELPVEVNNIMLDRMLFKTALTSKSYTKVAVHHGVPVGRATVGCQRVLNAIINSCRNEVCFPNAELLAGLGPHFKAKPDMTFARRAPHWWSDKADYYDGTNKLNSEKNVVVKNTVTRKQKRKSTRYELIIKVLDGQKFSVIAKEENVTRTSIQLAYHTAIRKLHYAIRETDDYPNKGVPGRTARNCCLFATGKISLVSQRQHKQFWIDLINRIVQAATE